MSNFFYWGEDFTYDFYVIDPDELSDNVDLSSVTDAPAIYVFDEKPDRTTALAGTGALETIVSWSDIGDGGKQFTISALSDPDPDDSEGRETYWLGINFVLEDGEQTQTVLRALPMTRAIMSHDVPGVTVTDLEEIYSRLQDYKTTTEIDAAIERAEQNIRLALGMAGFDYVLIWSKKELRTAIAYEALVQMMESLVAQSGDAWDSRGDQYRAYRDNYVSGLKLLYADFRNEEVENKEQMGSSIKLIR